MQQQVSLLDTQGLLFTLKEVTFTPEAPRKKDPFTVKGKVDLFGIPFLAPVWVIVSVIYPETWWEEIFPIIGAPEVRASDVAIGGNFEVKFPTGFIREGEFTMAVRVYGGPSVAISSLVLPPFPPVATEETTFIVAGELPPQEENFRNFRILSYSKGAGTPVTAPGVLNLNVGDVCRVNVAFEHTGPAVSGSFYAAIGNWKGITWPVDISYFDEVLKGTKAFSIPASTDWKSYTTGYYVDVVITSAISKGNYDLYVKVIGITGGDVFTPRLDNVIAIAGGGAATGAITGKHIDKAPEGTDIALPATVKADGNTFEVHVMAKNTGTESYIGGVEVKVYDPTGTLRASPTIDWTGISPGEELQWEYNNGAVDKAGSWVIKIRFLEKTTIKVLAETNTTMTATSVSADYKGSITSIMIDKAPEGSRILPTTVTASGDTFEVTVKAKNTGTVDFIGGVEVKVYDPDNVYRWGTPAIDWAGISPYEELTWGPYNVCAVDKAGSWTIKARFLAEDGKVLNEKQGIMTATSVAPEFVSITVQINADAAVRAFPGADRWMVYYWDPKANKFVGDNQWHYLSIWPGYQVGFDHVSPGGYLAVFLSAGQQVSQQFTSPEWTAVNGGHYEYDPYMNRIYPF